MSACEHCWEKSRMLGIEYHDQIARAERDNAPCTQNTVEGAKLRAGQWWEEETQRDKRDAASHRPEEKK